MTTLTSETLPVEESTGLRDYLPTLGKTGPYPAEMELFLRFLLIPAWIIATGIALLTTHDVGTLTLFFGVGGVVLASQFIRTKNPTGKFVRGVIYLSTFLAVGVSAFLITSFIDVATTPPTSLTSALLNIMNTVNVMATAFGGVLLLAITFTWSSVRAHNNRVS